MKLLPALLLLACVAAHADGDIQTYTNGEPCPNGPGLMVMATDEDGNTSWAGCWGADAVEIRDDEPHYHRHSERTRK
jgi:hypothetical protein